MTSDELLKELKSKHAMLSDRHNALVMSIELMMIENRERWEKQDALWQSFTTNWKMQNDTWGTHFAQIAASLDQLVRVAELHQHRIDSHDERIDKLEDAA